MRLPTLALFALLAGCAHGGASPPPTPDLPPALLAQQAAEAGEDWVGLDTVPIGDGHFTAAAGAVIVGSWAMAGVELVPPSPLGPPDPAGLWEALAGRAIHRREAALGDILFFHDTFDRNGNGARDDHSSHAALVVAVGDGDIVFVHGAAGVVMLGRLDTELRLRPDGGPTRAGDLLSAVVRPLGALPESDEPPALASRPAR